MKTEYHQDTLTLKVLDENNAEEVLQFLDVNKSFFDPFETDKTQEFYTVGMMKKILSAEYNAFCHGRFVRFYMYDINHPQKIIGTVSFSEIKMGAFRSCQVGYKIAHEFQKQGFGRRMLTMAIKIMVMEENMHRIEAYIAPGNVASIKLAETLGFINEGIAYSYVYKCGCWQDHLRYVYIAN